MNFAEGNMQGDYFFWGAEKKNLKTVHYKVAGVQRSPSGVELRGW